MSESEEGAYYSTFFCWKKLWNILEEIIKRFKTFIGYMGFSSQSQDHAQPQSTQSTGEEEEEVQVGEEYVETTTSTSRSIVGGSIMMFRAPPRRQTVSRGSGPKTN